MKTLLVFLSILLLLPSIPGIPLDDTTSFSTIIVSDEDPYFSIIATSIACSYRTDNWILKPLLVVDNGLTDRQKNFLDTIAATQPILILGRSIDTTLPNIEVLGSPAEVSLKIATLLYKNSQSVLILPYNSYKLSITAAPLASYLGIPILIYDHNDIEIQHILSNLSVSTTYIIGDIPLNLPSNIKQIHLSNIREIQETMLDVIHQKFNDINYLVLTNPFDILPPSISNTTRFSKEYNIRDIEITLLGKPFIFGEKQITIPIYIPDGVLHVRIYENVTKSNGIMNTFFEPIIYSTFFDSNGRVSAYAPSFALDVGKTLLDTLIVDDPGDYNLSISAYHGFRGGFFSSRGLSIVDFTVNITVIIDKLSNIHLPIISKLSMLAPYLAAVHGGIIIADENFSLTDEGYITYASGYPAGPWYTEELHDYNNRKVNYTVSKIKEILTLLDEKDMLDGYLAGPAWLAILGDTNMIPMYYYQPSQTDIYDRGLPSDNPYSLGENLSIGRIVSYNIEDVSLLICRTFFYKQICDDDTSWLNSFNFLFGEGFGETAGIFHQIPYSKEIKKYGFNTSVYGDLRNSREIIRKLGVFNSNYIEYMGHGDWFWFIPSIYGLDYYSKVFDVAHMKNWVFKPSVFLSAACLMGRTDGIPSYMNIGLTLLHAGCNCFIGATRETGQEAGLTVLENSLLLNDTSIGEALRAEKQIDKEPPTYYVRVLYGDPAFNPYEPINGFSNQGRPIKP